MAAPAGAPDLVVVDVGNTAVKVVSFGPRGAVLSAVRIPCVPGLTLPAVLRSRVPVVAVSVSERNLDLVEEALGRRLPLLGLSLPAGAGTGPDRLCAAAAAHARAGGAAVAAGLGTAVTVDAVDAAGVFLGGAIGPGLRSSAAGLASAAPRLPAPDLSPGPMSHPGTSTGEALRAGFLLGFAGLVDRLVEEAARAVAGRRGSHAVPVFLHGGDAGAVRPFLRTKGILAPHLVAEGARLLWPGAVRPRS